jgi:hypothetical protein
MSSHLKEVELRYPRRSWRLPELAERHGVSLGFLYKEANAGRLRIRKANTVSIVTDEDEAAWLAAMPILGESDDADQPAA